LISHIALAVFQKFVAKEKERAGFHAENPGSMLLGAQFPIEKSCGLIVIT
jgi:hypothetical protein